jgi:hypothetical protein
MAPITSQYKWRVTITFAGIVYILVLGAITPLATPPQECQYLDGL